MEAAAGMIAQARQWLGVPFHHQGRSTAGLDCLGLLMVVADAIGLRFEGKRASELDIPRYGARPEVAVLIARLEAHLQPVAVSAARPGDIVLLKVQGSPQHLAILSDYPVVGEMGMIHAYAPARAVVEHRYDEVWRRETYAVYRIYETPKN